ncbi:MAG: hypothetical protein EOP09_06610 [Proteobacteria bacterium]|nr:MAG: hypothetical protein EOP09_06610 [Pseudomonadota bacterium]
MKAGSFEVLTQKSGVPVKLIALCSISLFSTCLALPAFAVSDKELDRECREFGIQKIVTQAAAFDCEINVADIKLSEVDNRFYNPEKYLWYTVATQCEESPRTSITKLVQYRDGQCY